MKTVTIKTKVEKLSVEHAAWRVARVPRSVADKLGLKGNTRRVVCSINGNEPFQCALFPDGNREFFITLSKKLRDKFGIEEGETIKLEFTKDESKYGLPMPKELAEVLRQDSEGNKHFHALTPGNQRLGIRIVDAVTDVDKRIHRALILIECLKDNEGRFVYDEIYEALKRPIIDQYDP
jgi:hypothetical protein